MKYQIVAVFPSGIRSTVERHSSLSRAQAAVRAMDLANRHDLAEGYGFPYGVPTYEIIQAG